MTTLRRPLTIGEALDRALGALTVEHAATITGRKPGYLRRLSNPDYREQLTVIDMLKLDIEHIGVDGTAPIFETVAFLLKSAQGYVYTDAAQLRSLTVDLIRENGQAEVALVEAIAPGADEAAWARAEKEVADQQPVISRILAFIRQRRERGLPGSAQPP